MMFWENEEILRAIKAHAMDAYPEEACGLIIDDEYVPVENKADDPLHDFAVDPALLIRHKVQAIVHSHPDGPNAPTRADMEGQLACCIPYGICAVLGEAKKPFFWGDGLPAVPLIGREFRHGPSGTDGRGDCYSIVKDYYAQQGVDLPEFPRDDEWWSNGGNMYENNFAKAGFVEVDVAGDPQPGDLALMRIPPACPVANHAAVYIGDGLILHQLFGRLSRREPIGRWPKHIVKWLRRKEVSNHG